MGCTVAAVVPRAVGAGDDGDVAAGGQRPATQPRGPPLVERLAPTYFSDSTLRSTRRNTARPARVPDREGDAPQSCARLAQTSRWRRAPPWSVGRWRGWRRSPELLPCRRPAGARSPCRRRPGPSQCSRSPQYAEVHVVDAVVHDLTVLVAAVPGPRVRPALGASELDQPHVPGRSGAELADPQLHQVGIAGQVVADRERVVAAVPVGREHASRDAEAAGGTIW